MILRGPDKIQLQWNESIQLLLTSKKMAVAEWFQQRT